MIAAERYVGFFGASLVLVIAAAAVGVAFVVVFAVRYVASFPKQPDPGPETAELGPEPPAVANLLVNRWVVTRAAVPATLVDLAARRIVALEEVGPDRFVVRLRSTGEDGALTPYEKQVLAVVRGSATGGSAPVDALDLGSPTDAEVWWKTFSASVVADARTRGLARNRWSRVDWVILGGLSFVALALLASAFAVAHVGNGKSGNSNSKSDPEGWFALAGFAWILVLAGMRRLRSIRDTPSGRAAAARWLGVRSHLRANPSFADAPPASVAIWARSLGYGVALGVARATAAALPLGPEDPGLAWSRYGGSWHEVRVEYPTRFGYGTSPTNVLAGGLLRLVFFGLLAFVALPTVVSALWSGVSDLLPDASSLAELGLVAAFILVFGVMAGYLLVHLTDGAIRTARALGDLGRTVEVDGSVVKLGDGEQAGYVALDDGHSPVTRAWRAPVDGPRLREGMVVRAVMTPHLHHVTRVAVRKPTSDTRPQP